MRRVSLKLEIHGDLSERFGPLIKQEFYRLLYLKNALSSARNTLLKSSTTERPVDLLESFRQLCFSDTAHFPVKFSATRDETVGFLRKNALNCLQPRRLSTE